MSAATYLLGDVFEVMATMPDNSVDLILTSPPFLALRSYLPADHPNKHKEIGSEPNPAEFIDTLLALTAEWDRLLAPHGSIAVELGDTYSGSGGAGGDYQQGGMKAGQAKWTGTARSASEPAARMPTRQDRPDWPLDKSMCIIPHLYAASIAYGVNILTGETSPAGRWRVRNVIAWCRPNPIVGALGDKLRPATSFMVIAAKSADRWFDGPAVRVPASPNTNARTAASVPKRDNTTKTPPGSGRGTLAIQHTSGHTRPPYDHVGLMPGEEDLFDEDAWLISPEAYSGSHYATWPRRLLETPIESMCPREVCTQCGEPRRRLTESLHDKEQNASIRASSGAGNLSRVDGGAHSFVPAEYKTIGWTDCGCNAAWRNGHILDPFGGSGTTAVVATGHNRDCTLIDIDERNIDLARQRVGMFLNTPEPEKAA